MKSAWKHVLVPLVVVVTTSCGAYAQTTTSSGSGGSPINSDNLNFNHPPCDFSDTFYQGNAAAGNQPDGNPQVPGNGINVSVLDQPAQQRFGIFRQFGPPATGSQANWVTDPTCSQNDPEKTNVRILATTGGYSDDDTTNANQFISIIAFLTTPKVFTGIANARNIQAVDIIGNFEAYAAIKQVAGDGSFLPQPCGTMGQAVGGGPTESPPLGAPAAATTPCFKVDSVATPALRQDWRFATNRNALDGSDGNDPFNLLSSGKADTGFDPVTGAPKKAFNPALGAQAPFGYFCDDLLGAWIVTYFWFPLDPRSVDPKSTCGQAYAALAQKNGLSLDGTPVIKTPDDLNNTEALSNTVNGVMVPCAQEGNLDAGGADAPGAIWIICPGILDPRNGAIAKDAFLDHVTFPNGQAVDPAFVRNFNCLQQKGQFPGSLNDGSQPNGACQPGTGDL